MREATGPRSAPLAAEAHLLQPMIERSQREPQRVVAAYRRGNEFVDVTAGEVYQRVRAVAKGLVASGIAVGDRVALMSRSRLEWVITDYAILAVGGVTVPAYETSSAEQVQWILRDSGARIIVLEDADMHDLYTQVADSVPTCEEALVIDEGGLDLLAERGAMVDDADLDTRIASLTIDLLATIIYTSGTTGRPKGCMLTHGNLRTNVLQNLDAVGDMLHPEGEVSLLFLPLAHSLAKIITLVGVEWGVKAVFCSDVSRLQEELALVQPTMVVSVPRVFEKVYNSAQHKAQTEGHGGIFDKAADVAIRWSQAHTDGGHHPIISAEHAAMEPLVYHKIEEAFGSRLRFAFSGGGPLGERLTHFFHGVGVKIFEGYGLTETSPTLTVNRADSWRPGTVGRPLANTTIRIADDGEILARGPQVFQGYWRNDAATEETFDLEGWFKTGDIGELDDGYLRITGRKKELIVTAAGKNVAPAPLEDRLRVHPLISQAVVVGDGRPFVGVLVTLDEDAILEWATDHGLPGASSQELFERPELCNEIQTAVDQANGSVSRAESIRKFAVLPRDFTVAAGELTPTLKVRRIVVEKTYGGVIDAMYSG